MGPGEETVLPEGPAAYINATGCWPSASQLRLEHAAGDTHFVSKKKIPRRNIWFQSFRRCAVWTVFLDNWMEKICWWRAEYETFQSAPELSRWFERGAWAAKLGFGLIFHLSGTPQKKKIGLCRFIERAVCVCQCVFGVCALRGCRERERGVERAPTAD